MVNIGIQGLKDGSHEIEISVPVSEVEGIFPEFTGQVTIKGLLRKIGKRITIKCTAKCTANLECDYSLSMYQEHIQTEITLNYLLDTELTQISNSDIELETSDVHVIREDEKTLDITKELAEELSVSLPMKRISPEFRDKKLEDIIGDKDQLIDGYSNNTQIPDEDRWSVLKKIKFSN